MNLHETLDAIALQLHVNASDLKRYAAEDAIGGYHPDARLQAFPSGSVWRVEGQILYVLVRELKPASCLELGTFHGCSANHIGAALHNNGGGSLTCVDLHLPDTLFDNAIFNDIDTRGVQGDAFEFLNSRHAQAYDFIFDDLSHTPVDVARIWRWAVQYLAPGGIMVSHDALHFRIGVDVRRGIEGVVKDARYYLTEPSDCGLAIWQKPAQAAPIKTMQTEQEKPGDSQPLAAPQKSTSKRKSKGR